MNRQYRIGLAGGGNMGSALLAGLLAAKGPEQIMLLEKNEQRVQELKQKYADESRLLSIVNRPEELADLDFMILAVKPEDISEAARQNRGALKPLAAVVSVAAGVPLARLQELCPDRPVLRVMPNMPALAGQGVTALAAGHLCRPEDLAQTRRIFATLGLVVEVREEQMDAVTGLSGSGPAYVFIIIEALADAGVRQGLDRATALTLAAATVQGSASLVLQGAAHPAELKDKVASPGGTTIAGLAVLEKGGLRGLLMEAVAAASRRSRELSRG